MRLRGYDEYEVTLGDEMRGERASLGKTLLDAELDLRIRANIIRAIEDCDLDGFPNDSVVAGYVRSYARYLDLNPDDCYQRFCAESGFTSPVSALGGLDRLPQTGGLHNIVAAGAAMGAGLGAGVGAGLSQSRFAAKSARAGFNARVSLGGVTSVVALLALIGGLGYGGISLLQSIQRVEFAPLPEAPEVVAQAPLIAQPSIDSGLLRRPDANVYQGDGVLAAITPAELPPPALPTRDGPISAIDPATSGIFRDRHPVLANYTSPGSGEGIVAEDELTFPAVAGAEPGPAAGTASSGPPIVIIHAADTAWIRVRDDDDAVIFEGILDAGDRFRVPPRTGAPVLRAGNAGAVFILVNGAPYGPIGDSGQVLKNLSLLAADIKNKIPEADAGAIVAVPDSGGLQPAVAVLPQ